MNKFISDFDWSGFALLHTSVMTSVQVEMYSSATEYLFGDIADFGCGTAKITPFLESKPSLRSYVGIDASTEMINCGKNIVKELENNSNFQFIEGLIENVDLHFDSAVSLQSYYSWPKPEFTLRHIYSTLNSNGIFVIATPNQSLDMKFLLNEAQKELLGHPLWPKFKEHNQALADHESSSFLTLDDLISQLKSVSFKIEEAHSNFYFGGLNFIVARK